MHPNNRFPILLTIVFFAVTVTTCTKKWEEHNDITSSNLKVNLLQAITQTANMTKFTELLAKSGYDKVISSSKNFTVWAPTDQALQSLDPAVVNDTARLQQFVSNHITNQSYLTTAFTGQRIRMLNGKYITVTASRFDSANIVSGNNYTSNGIFHVIDKFIPRMDNIWELVNTTTQAPQMKSFLLSLNYLKFDPAQAIQTGVNPTTGQPTYQPGTGTVLHNTFLDTVLNVSDESNQYTMILLADNAYKAEYDKLTPWFQTQNADSTARLSGYWLVKDLAFRGAYAAAQLPDTMLSLSGVKVPVDRSAIIASYRTSNGMVHIMNKVNFDLFSKFPPVIIQGENTTPDAFSADRSNNTFYRIIRDSSRNQNISEILLLNYNAASFNIRYIAPNLNSMRYNVSWVVVNDFTSTWQQRLAMDTVTNTATFPYVTIPAVKNFGEVTLGQIKINNYRNLKMYLVGPATASSSGNTNVMALDYIKLTPAF